MSLLSPVQLTMMKPDELEIPAPLKLGFLPQGLMQTRSIRRPLAGNTGEEEYAECHSAQCSTSAGNSSGDEEPATAPPADGLPQTLMLRNLPRINYDEASLLAELHTHGCATGLDFIFVPRNKRLANASYAFVNYSEPALAENALRKMQGAPWRCGGGAQKLRVKVAHVQGLAANLVQHVVSTDRAGHDPMVLVNSQPIDVQQALAMFVPKTGVRSTAPASHEKRNKSTVKENKASAREKGSAALPKPKGPIAGGSADLDNNLPKWLQLKHSVPSSAQVYTEPARIDLASLAYPGVDNSGVAATGQSWWMPPTSMDAPAAHDFSAIQRLSF